MVLQNQGHLLRRRQKVEGQCPDGHAGPGRGNGYPGHAARFGKPAL